MRLNTTSMTYQELDGEAVVLDLASSTYLSVNRTGTLLLSLLREERSEQDLVEALAQRCDPESGANVAGDVAAFLHALRSRDLLIG